MLYAGTDRVVAVVDDGRVRDAFEPAARGDDAGESGGEGAGESRNDGAGDPGGDGSGRVECVAASRDRPSRAFAGTFGHGLFRTTDAGASWEPVQLGPASDGADASRVTAVAVAPWDPDVVFAGTEPSRVYRSTDGGESFEHLPGLLELPSSDEWAFPPRPHTHHVRWLEPDPHREGRVLVAIEAGALVVLDVESGTAALYRERPPGSRRDTHTLATHADAPGRAYAAAGDGYAERPREGADWAHPQAGLEHRYCWSVAVDPGDPDVRLVSAASGARTAHTPSRAETYVYRKRAEDAWELANEGLGAPVGQTRPVLAAGERAGEFYALSNRDCYRSTDAGETWTGLDLALATAAGDGTASALVCVPEA